MLNSAMQVYNDEMLPPPAHFKPSSASDTLERVETSSIAPQIVLHTPPHVLVPVDIKSAQSFECEEQRVVEFEIHDDHQNDHLTLKQEEQSEMLRATVSKPQDIGVPVLKDLPTENTLFFQVENIESVNLRESQQGN